MPTKTDILGCLTDHQLIALSLFTGLNKWGIQLTLTEISTLLNRDPKTIYNGLLNAQKRLTILERQGYL